MQIKVFFCALVLGMIAVEQISADDCLAKASKKFESEVEIPEFAMKLEKIYRKQNPKHADLPLNDFLKQWFIKTDIIDEFDEQSEVDNGFDACDQFVEKVDQLMEEAGCKAAIGDLDNGDQKYPKTVEVAGYVKICARLPSMSDMFKSVVNTIQG